MTALILGSYGNQFKAGQKLAQSMGLSGSIPVIGSDTRYNLLGASIVMGINAQVGQGVPAVLKEALLMHGASQDNHGVNDGGRHAVLDA